MTRLCCACAFYHPCDEAEGECRFHAPRPYVMERGREPRKVFWPVVDGDAVCGDWAPKE